MSLRLLYIILVLYYIHCMPLTHLWQLREVHHGGCITKHF